MESIYKLVMAIALAVCLTSCEPINRYLGLADDNMGEELIEAAIKMETGLEIDLTPTTPEK